MEQAHLLPVPILLAPLLLERVTQKPKRNTRLHRPCARLGGRSGKVSSHLALEALPVRGKQLIIERAAEGGEFLCYQCFTALLRISQRLHCLGELVAFRLLVQGRGGSDVAEPDSTLARIVICDKSEFVASE